jgi:molybdenum cofactor guanylyltransferase
MKFKMQNYSEKYSGILLAGGKSMRMGQDKAFMRYGESCLYEYSLAVLKTFSEDIFISSSNPGFSHLNYRIIEDELPGIGQIGGIYACLKRIRNSRAIVLPCDLPLITGKIIEILIENYKAYDICIALNDLNFPEPLIGIYSVTLVPVIESMIAGNQYKMQELFKVVKTNFVKIPDATPELFRNINNPGDFNSLPPFTIK